MKKRNSAPLAAVEIDEFLSIEETMALLKLSRATIDRMRADGRLVSTRKLGRPRILGASIKALFAHAGAAE